MTNNYTSEPHLEALRQLIALAQAEASKKQKQSGLPSLLDLIDTNTKDSKKWMNQCPIPTNEK